MVLTVWNDLTAVADFLLDTMGDIYTLMMSTILVVSIVFFVLRLVIKMFKKIF